MLRRAGTSVTLRRTSSTVAPRRRNRPPVELIGCESVPLTTVMKINPGPTPAYSRVVLDRRRSEERRQNHMKANFICEARIVTQPIKRINSWPPLEVVP